MLRKSHQAVHESHRVPVLEGTAKKMDLGGLSRETDEEVVELESALRPEPQELKEEKVAGAYYMEKYGMEVMRQRVFHPEEIEIYSSL
jgi:hypothetical protein